jgi:hypothetical protein
VEHLKGLPWTNGLAYYEKGYLTALKSFYNIGSRPETLNIYKSRILLFQVATFVQLCQRFIQQNPLEVIHHFSPNLKAYC